MFLGAEARDGPEEDGIPREVQSQRPFCPSGKLGLHLERWMHKTEALKLAEEKPSEEAGAGHDGRGRPPPLRNALHPLEELATGCQWHTRDRVISKPRPVELSVMGTAQRPLPEDERTAGQPSLRSLPPAGHRVQPGGGSDQL